MFWKIALALGVLGVVLGLVILIVSLRILMTTLDELAKDIALGAFLFSILLTLGAFLLIIVSGIFILRDSKREHDAKKAQ